MFCLSSKTRLLLPLAALLLTHCARREPAAPPPVVEAVPSTPVVVPRTVEPAPAATPVTAARDLADAMTTVLELRPDQTQKIRQIFANTVSEMNAARQKLPAKSAALNTELRRINAASEGQLKETLGAEKYQQYQTKRREIQAYMLHEKYPRD